MTTNNPTVRDLTARVEYLRNEETSLIVGAGKLSAYGIDAHINAVRDRLTAIKAEARLIAAQIQAPGLTDQAHDASHGWAIVIPPNPDTTSHPLSTVEETT